MHSFFEHESVRAWVVISYSFTHETFGSSYNNLTLLNGILVDITKKSFPHSLCTLLLYSRDQKLESAPLLTWFCK